MKRSMSALGASVVIGLIGCDNKPTTVVTPPEPVRSIQDTTRMGVVKLCDKQDLRDSTASGESYEKQYREWLKSCDPRVQYIVQHSKNLNLLLDLWRFKEHAYAVRETEKIFESVDELSLENQKNIREGVAWVDTIEHGDFTGLSWINWVAEQRRLGMNINIQGDRGGKK